MRLIVRFVTIILVYQYVFPFIIKQFSYKNENYQFKLVLGCHDDVNTKSNLIRLLSTSFTSFPICLTLFSRSFVNYNFNSLSEHTFKFYVNNHTHLSILAVSNINSSNKVWKSELIDYFCHYVVMINPCLVPLERLFNFL